MLRLFAILFLLFLELTAVAQSSVSSSNPETRGDTAQEVSVSAGDGALIEGIRRGDLPQVLKLLENGASPDATDDDGALALSWAIRVNRIDIVKVLLARKASVNKGEHNNGSALQVAAVAGRAQIVKLLLAHGADVNHKDRGGHTALMCAASGAMIRSAPQWLSRSFFGIDEDDELFTIIGNEHTLTAELLLSAGADANAQAEDCGLTPLMITAMSGNVELATTLIAGRADVNIKSGERNALKFAEEFGSAETIQKELEDCDDDESRQALLNWVQFTASGRQEVAKLLRKAGAR